MWFTATFVFCLALWRMSPLRLAYEEPVWLAQADLSNLLEPWNGFLQLFARAAFLAAKPFGDAAPIVTNVVAAGVIAALAAYFLTAEVAIPNRWVRLATALALPLLPTAYPGPYIGPLNSAWWLAIGVLLISLSPARWWHWPALVLAGLSGAAPCIALPLFRDRRGFALLVPVLIQLAVFAGSDRRPMGIGISEGFLIVASLLLGSLVVAPLPTRTRIGFAYLGVAVIAFGSIASNGYPIGQDRYLAIPLTGIALGVAALATRLTPGDDRHPQPRLA